MEASDGTQKRKIDDLAKEIEVLDGNWVNSSDGTGSAASSLSETVKVTSLATDSADVPAQKTANTVDPNQPNQNISIYHLLLDAQLDLKR